MKAYVFEWQGVYLGGTAVVIAETEAQARMLLASQILQDRDTDPHTAQDLITAHDLQSPSVLLYDNGDY